MKRILLGIALLLSISTAEAIPARPGQVRLLKLSDGTTVEARLVGDEFGHYWLAKDGRAFHKTKNGFAAIDTKKVRETAQKRRTAANRHRAKRQAMKAHWQPTATRAGKVGNYVGEKKGLIILVEFKDNYKFQPENDQALFNRIANEEGFNEGDFVGSVHDYFLAQSEGSFKLKFDVVGPYTLSHERAYYGENDNTEDAYDLRPAEMVAEACQLADADVNFKDYDWDSDGEVDQVYILYAGNGEANYGDEDAVWPHEWTLSKANYYGDGPGPLKLDGVTIDTYACSNELQPASIDRQGNVTAWKIDGIGTICHEFSHCLGYPDFYDTKEQNSGMGYWDLMDIGSYNGDSYCPAGYTSYERWVAGWKEPIELTEDTEITGMKALQKGGDTYVIYNDGNRNEFFLLENRQWTDWDDELPGEGLLILHVDYDEYAWRNNEVNDTKNHERMTWIAADNYKAYTRSNGKNHYDFWNMGNDTYPYGKNNSFSNTSTPAADVFNTNTDGSKKLNKSVTEITKNSDGTVSFKFQATSGPNSVSDVIWSENWDFLNTETAVENILNVSATYKGDGGQYCKIFEENLAGGTVPELLIPKKSRPKNYFTATITLGDANGNLPLSFRCNKEIAVTSETSGVTLTAGPVSDKTYSYTVSVPAGTQKIVLKFATISDQNARIDNLVLSKPATSAIEKLAVSSGISARGIFDLQGRKMSENAPLRRGIYIVNGKKFVVK